MPHAVAAASEFTPDTYPEFPAGLPTVELETISLRKLLDGDAAEQDRVFAVCQGRGFFYLELAGTDSGAALAQGAEDLARLGAEVFALPPEEKMQYRGARTRSSRSIFGYKYAGATLADKASGVRDTAEFFNISKDDMLAATPDAMEKEWPALILERRDLFRHYVTTAHGIGMLLLGLLVERLGIDPREIWNRHRITEKAGDHVRITRGPPRDTDDMPEIQTPSHTDFGTITLLMNWLGGLQVWSESARAATINDGQPPEGPGEWLWVVPKRGCAIVNLGDAAVKFTNGALCAGRHRVIPAPGPQGRWPRYSLVYFVRPEDEVVMETLKGPGVPATKEAEEEEKLTATEWIFRQTAGLGWKLGDEDKK